MTQAIEAAASVILLLLGFVFVLVMAYWVTRQVGKRYGGGLLDTGRIKVLERMPLSQDRMLCIVQVAGKTLLVGITPHSMDTLCELDGDALPPLEPAPQAGSFKDVLGAMLSKVKPTPSEEEKRRNGD